MQRVAHQALRELVSLILLLTLTSIEAKALQATVEAGLFMNPRREGTECAAASRPAEPKRSFVTEGPKA